MKDELLREAPVNTQGNLNIERIGTMWIPLPPLLEQKQITKHIEMETIPFDTAITRTEREISLMQEYRTRLTADIVTGKLDVREATAKLPDPPAEPETGIEYIDDADLENEIAVEEG
jgi:type I restriction enzyme S subunit